MVIEKERREGRLKPYKVLLKNVKEFSTPSFTASKQKYIPPSQRGAKGGPVGAPSTEKKFLSQMEDPLKMEGKKKEKM